ncbi:MAG: thiol:disulfide interchange protein DsbA/DsbL [Porticoccaceae bacterium]|nr:thiol:disulfide interchange protein DsbA/DsbL [Porticoccaceae bacterium]
MATSFNSLAETGTNSEKSAAAEQKYVAGTHYQVLDTPVRTSNPSKIEATEVFWYGCGHCYSFEPTILPWSKTLAEDVNFVKSPAIWHPSMALHARAFYAAKALGVLDTLHSVIFQEMNLRKNKLANESAISKLFVANGVDTEKFKSTFNSFGVNSAVQQAESRQRGYQITGTPEMIVNGKYRVTARMAGSQAGMLKVVDYLIDLERTGLPAKTATEIEPTAP